MVLKLGLQKQGAHLIIHFRQKRLCCKSAEVTIGTSSVTKTDIQSIRWSISNPVCQSYQIPLTCMTALAITERQNKQSLTWPTWLSGSQSAYLTRPADPVTSAR